MKRKEKKNEQQKVRGGESVRKRASERPHKPATRRGSSEGGEVII
jgi:hypothetical protein